ncbi:MAG: hypothetical protein J6A18_07335, partial [Alistipes sp.]|nr:hypothetical protein [Alistipes sp.]
MGKLRVKYLLSVAVVLLLVQFVFGLPSTQRVLTPQRPAIEQDTLSRDSVRRARQRREAAGAAQRGAAPDSTTRTDLA